MSELCLVDLKECKLKFDKLNCLAKELVKFAVDNDFAVFFQNSYFPNLFRKDKIKHYFLMSDSFIYQNCDFLSIENMSYEQDKFKDEFMNKFGFFNRVLEIVFSYGFDSIDIYIADGGVETIEDFDAKQTTVSNFVTDLYKSVIDDTYSYQGFKNIRFEISRG